MNDVIKDVEKLKENLINSSEYKNYKKCEKIIDSNKEINEVIDNIKNIQKIIINKEDKKKPTDKEDVQLSSLYQKLYSYKEYNDYIQASKELNEIITCVQKEFENYFNRFII